MNSEFLPKDELAKFIVLNVVRPQLETFAVLAFEAQTVFVTKNQRKPGPTIGAVKLAIPIQVEIHCVQILPLLTQVTCQGRLTQWPPSNEPLEWDFDRQSAPR